MKILSIDAAPLHTIQQRVAAGGGKSEAKSLQVHRGVIRGLPDGVEALVVASDLQGIAMLQSREATRLVGEVLSEELSLLAERDTIPPLSKVGVILAGNLYSAPNADELGVSGDVRPVWNAFAGRHRWVAGVAGLHDTFGDVREERDRFAAQGRVNLLDGDCVVLDGVRVGGVGYMIGDASKPGRREEKEYLRALRRVLDQKPALVVLHQGPDAKRGELRGHASIRQAFDRSGEMLVVCGHVYWREPMTDIRGGAQVLNVNGRVVLLERERA